MGHLDVARVVSAIMLFCQFHNSMGWLRNDSKTQSAIATTTSTTTSTVAKTTTSLLSSPLSVPPLGLSTTATATSKMTRTISDKVTTAPAKVATTQDLLKDAVTSSMFPNTSQLQCPLGWVSSYESNLCYTGVLGHASFQSAQSVCTTINGTAPETTTEEMWNALSNYFLGSIWLNARVDADDVRLLGNTDTFSSPYDDKWVIRQPDSSQQCVVMAKTAALPTFEMFTHDCDDSNVNVVCTMDCMAQLKAFCTQLPVSNATKHADHSCFAFYTQLMSWKQAFNYCQDNAPNKNMIGRLAWLTTQSVYDALLDVQQTVLNGRSQPWIGARERSGLNMLSDVYWYMDSETPSHSISTSLTPEDFGGTVMLDFVSQQCIRVSNWSPYAFYDSNCDDDKQPFVCEYRCKDSITASNSNNCQTKVNCTWNAWSSWSSCSASCGGGSRNRSRSISTLTQYNSAPCIGNDSETEQCNNEPCAVNCVWSAWSNFSSCTATCGYSMKTQYRNKTIQEAFGGNCSGFNQNTVVCTLAPCPINCTWNNWSPWSSCSTSCGFGTQTRTRTKKVMENSSGVCDGNSTANQNCSIVSCSEWTNERVAAVVVQTLGCTTLIGLLSSSIVIYALLRDTSIERFLHFNQEVSLLTAHVIIVLLHDPTRTSTALCLFASISLQYFFFVSFTFMALDGLQSYAMRTAVIYSGGFFSRRVNLAVGWGLPAIHVLLNAAISYDSYVSQWSCWINFGRESHWVLGSLVPAFLVFMFAIGCLEAASDKHYPKLLGVDESQYIAAQVNSRALLLFVPSQAAAWLFGAIAVYKRDLSLYSTVFILNVTLGVVLFVFHVMGNPKTNIFVRRTWKRFFSRSRVAQSKP